MGLLKFPTLYATFYVLCSIFLGSCIPLCPRLCDLQGHPERSEGSGFSIKMDPKSGNSRASEAHTLGHDVNHLGHVWPRLGHSKTPTNPIFNAKNADFIQKSTRFLFFQRSTRYNTGRELENGSTKCHEVTE